MAASDAARDRLRPGQQLARLRLEGLVTFRRDGKQVYYSIADDDVLGAMLVQLGATVVRVEDVFRPEHGAYGGGHHHSHGQDDDMHYAPRIHQFGLIDR